MYLHMDLKESVIQNIITSLSGDLDMERYRKEESQNRLKDAQQEIHDLEYLREANEQLNGEKRELEAKLDGANAVVDDLINDGQAKDARIKALTNENAALQETIRGMSERIEQLLQGNGMTSAIGDHYE